MEANKAIVVLFALVAVARADSATTNDGGHEAGCIDGESGRVYRLWESWAPAEEGCKLFTCMVDGAVGEKSCGRLQASPGCTLVYPKGSYPECCPRLWCPAGVERISVLLSGKAGQSKDHSEITEARQDIQHGSSGQEDHRSFFSGATSLDENGPDRTEHSKGPQQILLTGQDQYTRQALQENKQSLDTQNFQPPIEENSGWQSDQPSHYRGSQYDASEQTAQTRDDLGRIPHSDNHASDRPHHHAGQPNQHLSGLHDSSNQPLLGRRHSAHSQSDDIASPAQHWRQHVSHFTSHHRTEERAPGSVDAATQTPSFLYEPNKESSNRPFDTILRLFPQSGADLLQPVDLRSMLSRFNPRMDMSKPQSPLAVFSNIFKLIPGLPGSPEEMLKQILPPGMSPSLPISVDNIIRLIVPDYTPGKPVTILELLNKIISRVPIQISEFLKVPRNLFQLPNLSPNLFQFPSGLLNQQSGSGQQTSNPIDLLRRLLPFNPLSSDTVSSLMSNNPVGPQSLLAQRSPAVLLSNLGSNAPQGSSIFASRDILDKFPSGSQPGFTSFTSIIPSAPVNNEQLLRVVGDTSRRPFDTQGPGSYSNPQLQTSNSPGGLFGI